MTVHAYSVEHDKDGYATGWQRHDAPPYLQQVGGAHVLHLPPGETHTGFINGMPVVGRWAPLRPGDLIRVYGPGNEEEASYWFGGASATLEPGNGRACCFTGEKVTGSGIVCPGPACGKFYCLAVADQLGTCPACGTELGADAAPATPGDELL